MQYRVGVNLKVQFGLCIGLQVTCRSNNLTLHVNCKTFNNPYADCRR